MKNLQNINWWKAATIRAIKTAAQVVLGMLTVGMAANEIDWLNLASVAAVAAFYSFVTSLAGLPEVEDGAHDDTADY